MIRGTTPLFSLHVKGIDLTTKSVYITVQQASRKYTKTGSDLAISYDGETSTVEFSLTQEETLSMRKGWMFVQLRCIDSSGLARSTPIREVCVGDTLYEKVIAYEP